MQSIKYTIGTKALEESPGAFFSNSWVLGHGKGAYVLNPNVKDELEKYATGSAEDGSIEKEAQTHDMLTKNKWNSVLNPIYNPSMLKTKTKNMVATT